MRSVFAFSSIRPVATLFVAGVVLGAVAAGCGRSHRQGSSTPTAAPPATSTSTLAPGLKPAPPSPAKARYEIAMKTLGTSLEASLRLAGESELAAATSKTATGQDVRALRNAQTALRAAAVTLARIDAPAGLRHAQALLIKGVEEYASGLDGVIAQLRAGGAPRTVLQQVLHLKGLRDMQRASIEIAQHGYSIVAG